jgi:hypothetical protein
MIKVGIVVTIVIFLLGFAYVFSQMETISEKVTPTPTVVPTSAPSSTPTTATPSDEEAELVAFGFMQDFATEDYADAHEALSMEAKAIVSEANLEEDLMEFIGVEEVPESGVSVEDLQVSDDEAYLIVGMNYSAGRILRRVNMVVENGEWKVNSVEEQVRF